MGGPGTCTCFCIVCVYVSVWYECETRGARRRASVAVGAHSGDACMSDAEGWISTGGEERSRGGAARMGVIAGRREAFSGMRVLF